MGTDIKALRARIRSVGSTLQLTRAMGLVASAKIRSATEEMLNARKYSDELLNIVATFSANPEIKKSSWVEGNLKGTFCLVVFAGDRGLAGGYNSNIFKLADELSPDEIIPIGKRACERYKKQIVPLGNFDYATSEKISAMLFNGFKTGKYGRVGIISTKYQSMLTQKATLDILLPLSAPLNSADISILYEPDMSTVFDVAVREHLTAFLYATARESLTCEVVARRLAMDSASKNANQLIDELQLKYNQARQSSITQEITEIIAGSGL